MGRPHRLNWPISFDDAFARIMAYMDHHSMGGITPSPDFIEAHRQNCEEREWPTEGEYTLDACVDLLESFQTFRRLAEGVGRLALTKADEQQPGKITKDEFIGAKEVAVKIASVIGENVNLDMPSMEHALRYATAIGEMRSALHLQRQGKADKTKQAPTCDAEQAKLDRVCHPAMSFYAHPNPETCFKLADEIAFCQIRKIVFGTK